MYVFERTKPSLGHLVDKYTRPFKLGDLDRQSLPHSNVSSFERDRLSQTDQTLGNSGECPFICMSGRFSMDPNIPHQIKANVGRSMDRGFDKYLGH